MIRAKARGESAGSAPAPRQPHAAPAPAPAKPAGGKKIKRGRGPAQPGLAGNRRALPSWPRGSTPRSGKGRSASCRPRLLVPPEKLVEVALYLRDK